MPKRRSYSNETGTEGIMKEVFGAVIVVLVLLVFMIEIYIVPGGIGTLVTNMTKQGGVAVIAATLTPIFYWIAVALVPILILYAVIKHIGM
jgi:glucan phosphoethanolaminetransferase (alkaline phosphatase superfamily)